MPTANDFFPSEDAGQWRFVEANTGQRPAFSFRSQRDGDRRLISLDDDSHEFRGFFDRMTVTPAGLELNRIHFGNRAVDIPPWLLTLSPEDDAVNDVLPADLDGTFGEIRHPFTGVTTEKSFPPADQTTGCWVIGLEIAGVGGKVLDMTLRFGTSLGLCAYSGQVYGGFSFYARRDEPGCEICP